MSEKRPAGTPERAIIESLFRVIDKDGIERDFLPNEFQARIDSQMTGRDIIPKPRQVGVSTWFLARGLARCLSRPNTNAVVISHDTESTQRMLGRVQYMIESMRGPKPVVKNSNKNEITFPKVNSQMYIGTAGSRKFGRGDTIHFLHCSEAAFWENAKDLLAGLFQAVPINSGQVSIESTGNGKGNWYHKQCMRAYKGQSQYTLHFTPWNRVKEYELPVSLEEERYILANLDPDLGEDEEVERGLRAGHIKFRRLKLDELDYDQDLFKQEYPMTLDECFRGTGHSIFHRVNYKSTDRWKRISKEVHALEGPWEGPVGQFVVGVDPSGGVGKDDAVIEVFSVETLEQVAEWVSSTVDPELLAYKVKEIAVRFNRAFVVVETNNHGAVTLKTLKDIYDPFRLFKQRGDTDNLLKYGFKTSAKTKPVLINKLRTVLKEDAIIHSPYLRDQLDSFIETPGGSLEAETGAKDDAVIASALAIYGVARAVLTLGGYTPREDEQPKGEFGEVFTLDSAIENIRRLKMENGRSPIKEQI